MNFYSIKNLYTQCEPPKWAIAWSVDDERKPGGVKCPLCGGYVTPKPWLDPKKIRLTSTRFPDRLSAWIGEPMAVSERVKDAYIKEGLTGIKSFTPIEVVKVARMKEGIVVPRYFCGKLEFTDSVILDKEKTIIIGQKQERQCELCAPFGTTIDKEVRIVIDTSKWNGLDVFSLYTPYVFVSQRFVDFVERYGFTNFCFEQVETSE